MSDSSFHRVCDQQTERRLNEVDALLNLLELGKSNLLLVCKQSAVIRSMQGKTQIAQPLANKQIAALVFDLLNSLDCQNSLLPQIAVILDWYIATLLEIEHWILVHVSCTGQMLIY